MRNLKINTARMSEEEKEELIRLSRSSQLRKDMRRIKCSFFSEAGNVPSLDDYISFVTTANAFANHQMKPFRKIKGKKFKI